MKQWRQMITAVALLSPMRMFSPVQAEASAFVLHTVDEAGKPLAGMVYALYEDEDLQFPVMQNEQAVELASSQRGRIRIRLKQDRVYAKVIDAPAGYYEKEEAIELHADEAVRMQAVPIAAETKLKEDVQAELYKEEECIAVYQDEVWKADDEVFRFEAGETYFLHCQDEAWLHYEDRQIQIPRYPPADGQPILIQAEGIPFGRVNIQSSDENSEVCIFRDQEGNEAFDIYGQKAEKKNSYDLAPGIYYLRVTEAGEEYWPDDALHEFAVEAEKETECCISLQQPKLSLSAADCDHPDVSVNGTWRIRDNATDEEIPVKQNSAMVLRNHSYTASFRPECGYYVPQETVIHIPDQKTELNCSVKVSPILIRAELYDSISQEAVTEALMILETSEGSDEVPAFAVFHARRIKEGETFRLSAKKLPAGYLSSPAASFTVSSDGGVMHAAVQAVPYGTVKTDEKNVLLSLYEDEACTKPVKDIYGNTALNITEADLFYQTCYVRESTDEKEYYPQEQAVKTVIDHRGMHTYRSTLQKPKIIVRTISQDQLLSGVSCTLKDSHGKKVRQWLSLGEETITDGLMPGSTYELLVQEAPGLYTYDHEAVKITIPEIKPKEEAEYTLSFEPYVSLRLRADQTVFCQLYEDEACVRPAEDIHDRKAEDDTDQDGLCFMMRPGMYWLKAKSRDEHLLVSEEVQKLDLMNCSWSSEYEIQTEQCRFIFLLEDEYGQAIEGAEMFLLDETGKEVYRWKTEKKEQIIADPVLQKGRPYTIKADAIPENLMAPMTETSVTMPSAYGEDVPKVTVTLRCIRKLQVSSHTLPAMSQKEQRESSSLWKYLMPVSVAVLLCILIPVFIKRRKQ